MNELNEKEQKIELTRTVGELGANIMDTQDVIGVYGDFLKYAKSQEEFSGLDTLSGVDGSTEVDIRAKELYSRVYEGLGLSNVDAGYTGRVGGSVGIQAGDLKAGVLQDIKTGSQQFDVYKTSLDVLKEAKTEYIDMLMDLQSTKEAQNSTLYKNDAEYRAEVDQRIAKAEAKAKEEEEKNRGDRDRAEEEATTTGSAKDDYEGQGQSGHGGGSAKDDYEGPSGGHSAKDDYK